MEQLDKSDWNGQRKRENINHFLLIYESDNEKFNKHGTKPKTLSIVSRGNEKGSKNKGCQNKSNEEDGSDQKKKTTAKMYDLNSEENLNGQFGTA